MIDAAELQKVASKHQQRIRQGLASWRAKLAAEGKDFPNVDESAYVQFVVESYMRALSESPMADKFILKGGRLSAIRENSPIPHRPTLDLDLQRQVSDLELHKLSEEESLEAFKAEVLSIVGNEDFIRRTGLVFDLDSMTYRPIKEDQLPDSWAAEGFVSLGSVRIKFILEVSSGAAPAEAFEEVEHPAFLTDGPAFKVLAARPEWQVAEKLHAIVSRPQNNSRYKDWLDLVRLGQREKMDPRRLAVCLEHVFVREFGGEVPRDLFAIPGLLPGKATAEHEKMWQSHFFQKLNGKAFDPAKDASLLALVSAAAASIFALGVLKPPPAAECARAVADLARATTPGSFAEAFDRMVETAAVADPKAISWHLMGEIVLRGMPPTGKPSDLLADTFERARASGLCARIPGKERLKGALKAVAERLDAPMPTPTFLADAPAPKAAPVKAGRAAPSAEEVAKLLAKVAPGAKDARNPSVWMTALATAARALHAGVAVEPVEVADCPLPASKAAPVWASVCKSQGLDTTDLDGVLEALRPAPALAM